MSSCKAPALGKQLQAWGREDRGDLPASLHEQLQLPTQGRTAVWPETPWQRHMQGAAWKPTWGRDVGLSDDILEILRGCCGDSQLHRNELANSEKALKTSMFWTEAVAEGRGRQAPASGMWSTRKSKTHNS